MNLNQEKLIKFLKIQSHKKIKSIKFRSSDPNKNRRIVLENGNITQQDFEDLVSRVQNPLKSTKKRVSYNSEQSIQFFDGTPFDEIEQEQFQEENRVKNFITGVKSTHTDQLIVVFVHQLDVSFDEKFNSIKLQFTIRQFFATRQQMMPVVVPKIKNRQQHQQQQQQQIQQQQQQQQLQQQNNIIQPQQRRNSYSASTNSHFQTETNSNQNNNNNDSSSDEEEEEQEQENEEQFYDENEQLEQNYQQFLEQKQREEEQQQQIEEEEQEQEKCFEPLQSNKNKKLQENQQTKQQQQEETKSNGNNSFLEEQLEEQDSGFLKQQQQILEEIEKNKINSKSSSMRQSPQNLQKQSPLPLLNHIEILESNPISEAYRSTEAETDYNKPPQQQIIKKPISKKPRKKNSSNNNNNNNQKNQKKGGGKDQNLNNKKEVKNNNNKQKEQEFQNAQDSFNFQKPVYQVQNVSKNMFFGKNRIGQKLQQLSLQKKKAFLTPNKEIMVSSSSTNITSTIKVRKGYFGNSGIISGDSSKKNSPNKKQPKNSKTLLTDEEQMEFLEKDLGIILSD